MGRYAYFTLPEKGWLRILVIQPSPNRNDIVRASLLHCPIDALEKEGYETLSYCWGTDKKSIPIEVDGAEFLVRPPLHTALLRLRHATQPRRMWIDAICINQGDITERSNQVAQMRDVYSRATRVVVWLGDGERLGIFGMHILQKWARAANNIEDKWKPIMERDLDMKHGWYAEWTALWRTFQANKVSFRYRLGCVVPLFRLGWWTRMWTVQELILAREAVVQYGDKTVAWRDFETIAKLHTVQAVHSHSVEEETGMIMHATAVVWACLMAAENLRVLLVRRKLKIPISLSMMLDMTGTRLSTDPRDKIFAALGGVDLPIESRPDYSKCWQEVYTTAMKDVLREFNDLRAYDYMPVSDSDVNKYLPSWVPNFGQDSSGKNPSQLSAGRLCPGRGGGPEDYIIQEAAGPLYFAGLTLDSVNQPKWLRFEDNDKVLRLKGCRFDAVSKLCGQAPHGGTLSTTILRWRSSVPELEELYLRGQGRSQTKKEAFWRTVCLDCKVHFFHTDITIKNNPRNSRRRLNAYDRRIPPAIASEETELLRALDKQNEWNEGAQPGRVFFLTKRGYMGLGPPRMKLGDTVAVFLGGQAPFIVRQGSRNRYRLIGQCYVHGIMDGEALGMRSGMKMDKMEEIRIE
ncbi:HET-domain-containing protein [Cladorrhinum sp. PSN259]|nr:HET-domain-containing protein [Cladorrhinum sp. PSN259]